MDEQTTAQDHDEETGLSRRAALGYGAAATGVVAGAAVLAAGPAAAAGGGAMHSVTLSQANRIITAALRYVRDNDLPSMYVIVVDVCGDEKAAKRMDGNRSASTVLAPVKARTSAAFGASTKTLGEGAAGDLARIASFTTAGFSLLGGGVPIVRNGAVIGAVGVGGGSPDQDDEVAQAGIAAI